MDTFNEMTSDFRLGRAPKLLIVVSILLAIIYPVAWPFVKIQTGIDRDLYTPSEITGPYALTTNKAGDFVADHLISNIKAGETFGYIADVCLAPNVSGFGITQIILLPENHEITMVQNPIFQGKCSPHLIVRSMPIDAPPGYYEIRRSMLLRKDHESPVSAVLQSLHITVVK